jgi:hypothetical protein
MGLKLDKLARSEWDMPLHVCTRINPVLLIQNQNKVSDCFENQDDHGLSDNIADSFKRNGKGARYPNISY